MTLHPMMLFGVVLYGFLGIAFAEWLGHRTLLGPWALVGCACAWFPLGLGLVVWRCLRTARSWTW